jgi:hypothetical protein
MTLNLSLPIDSPKSVFKVVIDGVIKPESNRPRLYQTILHLSKMTHGMTHKISNEGYLLITGKCERLNLCMVEMVADYITEYLDEGECFVILLENI